ncbi:MAG: hypothetical protein WAS73_17675 [Defluviicoccus sp.]
MADGKPWLERYSPLLVAVISASLGATASHYWTRSRTLEEQVIVLRKSAYADFLEGQSLLWAGKQEEANPLILKAKLDILLTSSRSVVCTMAGYWVVAKQYEACPDPDLRRKDATIYVEMRREFFKTLEIPGSPELNEAVVVPYLWSCTIDGGNFERLCSAAD